MSASVRKYGDEMRKYLKVTALLMTAAVLVFGCALPASAALIHTVRGLFLQSYNDRR